MSSEAASPSSAAPAAPAMDNLRGAGWMLVSVLGASAMILSVKALTGAFDSRMVLAQRTLFTVALTLPFLLALPRLRRGLRFSRPGLHVLRGGLTTLGTVMGFYSIAHLPTATAATLFLTAPIFATLISAVLYGERVGLRRWLAVAAAFIGVLVILRPGAQRFEPALLVALVSACVFALSLSMSRGVARADGAVAVYASTILIALVISLPLAAPVWALPTDGPTWAILAVLVLGGAIRGFADIQAYRYAEASVLAPVSYLRLIVIAAAAYAILGEVPDLATGIGAAIIVLAALYVSHRERIRRRRVLAMGPMGDPAG